MRVITRATNCEVERGPITRRSIELWAESQLKREPTNGYFLAWRRAAHRLTEGRRYEEVDCDLDAVFAIGQVAVLVVVDNPADQIEDIADTGVAVEDATH